MLEGVPAKICANARCDQVRWVHSYSYCEKHHRLVSGSHTEDFWPRHLMDCGVTLAVGFPVITYHLGADHQRRYWLVELKPGFADGVAARFVPVFGPVGPHTRIDTIYDPTNAPFISLTRQLVRKMEAARG